MKHGSDPRPPRDWPTERPVTGTASSGRPRRAWRRTAVLALLLAAAGLGARSWGPHVSAASTPRYRVMVADVGPIVSVVATGGTVKPLAAIQVGSQASGQIRELLADFNTAVKRGDVIARLDDDAARARLAQALAEVDVATTAAAVQRAQVDRARAERAGAETAIAVAKAELDRAQAAFRNAERELDRKRELVARGAGSAAERDRAEAGYDAARAQLTETKAREQASYSARDASEAALATAKAQLDNAVAQVRQREAIVHSVRIDVEHTVVRAPIDGVVIDRNVEVGQTLAASLQTPTLFTIAPDLRAMEVHASVDEAEIGRVAPAQAVAFTVDSFPGKTFPGRVVDIRKVPQATQNVVAYTVLISAENNELLLLPGMTVTARIIVARRDAATRVANAALRFRPPSAAAAPPPAPAGTAELWVIGGAGEPEPRRVTLGISDGSFTEIVAGELRSGEQVVIGVEPDAARRTGPGSV